MATPVKQVKGIGPKTAEYLAGKGIETAEQLIDYGVANLAKAPGFSAGRAETVMTEGKQQLGLVQPSELVISFAEKEKPAKDKKSKKERKKNKNKKDKKKDKKQKKEKKENKK